MPAPTLVSSSPTNGQSAVVKNPSIAIVFDVALGPTTVSGATVTLFNSKLNSRVECEVGLSADGKTISLSPSGHLFPNTGHRIRVTGVDLSPVCLKSSTGESLATTITLTFQTGDTLDTGPIPPDPDHGDLDLPDNVNIIGGGGPLQLISTDPEHQAFGISPAISQLSFRFNAPIDPGTVTGNVIVRQTAFYDEESFLARETNLGQGGGARHYFAAETGTFNAVPPGFLDPELFRDRDYTLVVQDDVLTVLFDEDYTFPKNLAIEVILQAGLSDTTGNVLGEDFLWLGLTEPYPSWASLQAVRHQAGYGVSSVFPDSYVGLRTWMSTMDMLGEFNWCLPTDKPSRYAMEYVRIQSALEIWNSVIEDKGVNAGTSKRLGDFEVSVNTAAGSARPSKMRVLEERLAELDRVLWGGLTQTPRVGVRSILDAYEPSRGYFRDRLWRLEIMRRQGVASLLPAANTADERRQGGGIEGSAYYSGARGPGGAGTRHSL